MLLDLGRNDVGRVAKAGTVQGDRQLHRRTLQPRHAHRLERAGPARHRNTMRSTRCSPAFRPAPSAARPRSAPARSSPNWKVRNARRLCRRRRLFRARRQSVDSCIVLRTGVVKDGVLHVQAGAGIVADSDPEYEQRECEAKAGALFAAAREAVGWPANPVSGNRP
jgi:anthranilate synthase component I